MALATLNLAFPVKFVAIPVLAGLAAGTGAVAAYVTAPVPSVTASAATTVAALPGTSTGPVTAYEPPHRMVHTSEMKGRTLAFEYLVEATDGGTCVVRLVNSGFGTEPDWDGEFHAMTAGWTLFLDVLRLSPPSRRRRPSPPRSRRASSRPGRISTTAVSHAEPMPHARFAW